MNFILVLGNSDKKVCEKRADMAVQRYKIANDEDLGYGALGAILIFCGYNGEAEYMRDFVVNKRKIPEKDCIIENESKNTVQNIVNAKKKIEEIGYYRPTFDFGHRYIICTSKFHIERSLVIAKYFFEGLGIIDSFYDEEEVVPDKILKHERYCMDMFRKSHGLRK